MTDAKFDNNRKLSARSVQKKRGQATFLAKENQAADKRHPVVARGPNELLTAAYYASSVYPLR